MISRTTLWRKKKRIQKALNSIINNNLLWDRPRLESVQSLNDEANKSSITTTIDEACALYDNNQPLISSKTVEEEIWFEEDEIEIVPGLEFESMINDFDQSNLMNDRLSIPSEKELAAAVIILKNRHRTSIKCINHLCQLMKILSVTNFPSSHSRITQLLLPHSSTFQSLNTVYICSVCCSTTCCSSHCDNVECNQYHSYTQPPLQFLNIRILPQLQDILARSTKLNFGHQQHISPTTSSIVRDIYDANVYQRILSNEQGNFLSLIMNVDGVQISESSSSSLWISTFAINEINRNERFKMKNVIIGGILTAPTKPSRHQMNVFLRSTVNELIELEKDTVFEINSNPSISLKTFLIAACCDKPAQSLVQGISEPTGAYGCGRCELEGVTVITQEKSKKKIRVFPLQPLDTEQPRLRSNETYDAHMAIDFGGQSLSKMELRDRRRGHIAICILRELRYFDVGHSFVSDSLHNVYHGVVRRLLNLWFDKKYRRQPWSICSKIRIIDQYLSNIKYPSTSIRIPRSLLKYNQFKANELRTICLFGFPGLCAVITTKYARHFLLFVIAIHLSETKHIDRKQIDDVQILIDEFLRLFPSLYTSRHNTQSVHSLQHIADSVADFGSLGNYSTFNFESVLGMITSTVHSTRRHASEIQNNLKLLRAVCIALDDSKFNHNLKRFVQIMQSSKRSILSSSDAQCDDVTVRICDQNSTALASIQEAFDQAQIQLYKTCQLSSVRFTTIMFDTNRSTNDSCVLFNLLGRPAIGFIVNIVHLNGNQILFRIRRMAIKNKLCLVVNGRSITCPNVFHGDLNFSDGYVYIKPQFIIEKLIHVYDQKLKSYILFRVPNLCESS